MRHVLAHTTRILLYIVCLTTLSSCVDEEQFADTPAGNIEALWKIMDEHYCFFDYKKQAIGVDWNEVRSRYGRQADAEMDALQMFEVMTNMLSELRDGHVNLYTSFDMARNWSWKEDYPANFYDILYDHYMGTDYHIVGSMQWCILDDQVGYIRIPTFQGEIGEGTLDDVLYLLMPCRALIIDIRNNGGGMITAAERLAARFASTNITTGYMQHKTGKGHNDFSEMKPQKLNTSSRIRWHKQVFVLTNRSVFSAANEFVKYMKAIGRQECEAAGIPADNDHNRILIVGDRTGGGAGMPFSSELPNGWGVRFSACPMFDTDKNSTEQGIEPDIRVDITDADIMLKHDRIIETARQMVR